MLKIEQPPHLPEHNIMELLIITVLSFISALVTSIFGFGAGLVLTPLLSFIMPLKEALGIGAFIFLFTSGSKFFWYFKDVNWKTYRYSFGLSLIGLAGGFSLITGVETFWLEKIYAAMLIIFGLKALMNKDVDQKLLPRPFYPVMGGLFAALIHGGGAFFIRLCRGTGLNRMQTVATIAAIHFSQNIFKTAFFAGAKFIAPAYIITLAPAYIAAIIGTRLGRFILQHYVNEKLFSLGIGILLVLLSLKYII